VDLDKTIVVINFLYSINEDELAFDLVGKLADHGHSVTFDYDTELVYYSHE